jgi:hypothetical protein
MPEREKILVSENSKKEMAQQALNKAIEFHSLFVKEVAGVL